MDSENKIPRILVIDDDHGVQKLVTTLINRAKMEPITAMNATQGAQFLRTPPLPDALVLDLMLPDISGIDFLRQMRGKEAFDKIPVIILSAIIDPDQIREGLSLGADRYITKPYLASNLIDTLRDVLKTERKKEK